MEKWKDVARVALNTVGKEHVNITPRWKRQMLLAEHSPIRLLTFEHTWRDIPTWVSTHFCRHKFGVEHFVRTNREDRTGVERRDTTDHVITANAQAIINISRKRLCHRAHRETQKAWVEFLDELRRTEPELVECCVPECVYRGFCPERDSCGFASTENFDSAIYHYRKLPR